MDINTTTTTTVNNMAPPHSARANASWGGYDQPLHYWCIYWAGVGAEVDPKFEKYGVYCGHPECPDKSVKTNTHEVEKK